jgi:hypothetical protein
MIIQEVLLARIKPPQSPATDSTSRTDASSTCGLRLPVFPPQVQYSAYGLLLTNKQLRLETKDRLHQLPSPYALDVMLVGDDNHYDELWPTWLCCPSRELETIKVVEINIRNFSDETVPYLVRLNAVCGFADFRLPAKSGASLMCDLLDYVVSICASKATPGCTVSKLSRSMLKFRRLSTTTPKMSTRERWKRCGTPILGMNTFYNPRLFLPSQGAIGVMTTQCH